MLKEETRELFMSMNMGTHMDSHTQTHTPPPAPTLVEGLEVDEGGGQRQVALRVQQQHETGPPSSQTVIMS